MSGIELRNEQIGLRNEWIGVRNRKGKLTVRGEEMGLSVWREGDGGAQCVDQGSELGA